MVRIVQCLPQGVLIQAIMRILLGRPIAGAVWVGRLFQGAILRVWSGHHLLGSKIGSRSGNICGLVSGFVLGVVLCGAGVLVVQTNERSQTDREDGSGTEKLSDQVDLLFFVGLTMGRSYHIGSIFVKSGEYKIKRTFSERVPLKAFGAPSWSAILTELG